MMRQIHLWPEEATEVDGIKTVSVAIEFPNQSRTYLWYQVPVEYSSLISSNCDQFVVATVMLAMSCSADLVVHGTVSPSLLNNLAEFQATWACWLPKRYQPIEIKPEAERETTRVNASQKAISAFSGGVDSCFTSWRHRTGCCGRQQRNLQAALMVHGFDIPLRQKSVFNRAVAKSKEMLSSLAVELIPMATNFRELKQDWEEVYGAAVASCLMLLQGGYGIGMIPSGPSYKALILPHGSNPITDRLLSSGAFQIVHDGTGASRLEKIRQIANWPEALKNLRVCWEGSQLDRNCGKCEKCIRTVLSFRAMGLNLPPCFDDDVTEAQVLALKVPRAQLLEFDRILEMAKATEISDSWVNVLEKCIFRNRRLYAYREHQASLKKLLPLRVRTPLGKLRSHLPRRG
ncbi:hypothetical protein [Lyngbya aestuarii]|uniref:hypothetical protein n=1 Tax=Lyngbya aestuarii TaxID=118322 RepID=UPI00403D770E